METIAHTVCQTVVWLVSALAPLLKPFWPFAVIRREAWSWTDAALSLTGGYPTLSFGLSWTSLDPRLGEWSIPGLWTRTGWEPVGHTEWGLPECSMSVWATCYTIDYAAVTHILLLFAATKVFKALIPGLRAKYTRFRTLVLRRLSTQVLHIRTSVFRGRFRNTYLAQKREDKTHTHASAAAYRNAAVPFADTVARRNGLRLWIWQMSASDIRRGYMGSRDWHWDKDTAAEPRNDPLPEKPLVTVVDTDYHDDEFQWRLHGWQAPTLLYTVMPRLAAGTAMDTTWEFEGDTLCVSVDGGSTYRHRLWDYNVDTFATAGYFTYTTWCVDRLRSDEMHEYVLCTPLRTVFAPFAWLWKSSQLKRFDPRQYDADGIVWTAYRSGNGLTMAKQGAGAGAAWVSSNADASLRHARYAQKTELTPWHVRQCANLGTSEQDRATANIAAAYYRKVHDAPTNHVHPKTEAVRRYQMLYRGVEPDAKPSMHPWSSPVIDEAYCPDMCLTNDVAYVQDRVVKLADRDSHVDPKTHGKYQNYIAEFVEFFPRQTLAPKGVDEVIKRQPRPSQQSLIYTALWTVGAVVNLVKSFMKREAYQKPSDPRCISTIEPTAKLNYSRYLYAVSDIFKDSERFPWYAFSRTPAEVAHRVADVCMAARKWFGATDCSRMDGRVSALARYLEEVLMTHMFRPEYHDDLINLMETQHHVKCVTTFGYLYLSFFTRLSGSPETSAFNTILNACMAYCAIREDHPDLSPADAWARLGVYGGDDGGTADVEPKVYERVARAFGQLLTYETIPRGELGVNFLSRFFGPSVWDGNPNSMCDVARQLAKWHVSRHRDKEVAEIAAGKANGFALTDPNTPIIGELAKKTLEITSSNDVELREDGKVLSWWAQYDASVQFPNDVGDFAQAVIDSRLPGFAYDRFSQWLDGVGSMEDLTSPPLCMDPSEPKPAQAAVVRGEHHGSDEPPVEVHTGVNNPGGPQGPDQQALLADKGRGAKPRGRRRGGRGKGRPGETPPPDEGGGGDTSANDSKKSPKGKGAGGGAKAKKAESKGAQTGSADSASGGGSRRTTANRQ